MLILLSIIFLKINKQNYNKQIETDEHAEKYNCVLFYVCVCINTVLNCSTCIYLINKILLTLFNYDLLNIDTSTSQNIKIIYMEKKLMFLKEWALQVATQKHEPRVVEWISGYPITSGSGSISIRRIYLSGVISYNSTSYAKMEDNFQYFLLTLELKRKHIVQN